jgi:DNA-binding LacI/PurR family transcriptional regulator
VSNVVNGWPHVRPALRQHVQTVIDELGYRPNLAARYLRGGRTGMIALVIPEIDAPYFAELARCFGKELSVKGLTLAIEQTDGLIERERALVDSGSGPTMFDGIIFSPISTTAADFARRRADVPVVLIGEQLGAECDHVQIDNIAASQVATQHLIELGRQRIALIGHQPGAGINTSDLRVEGYKAALRAASLPIDPQLLTPTPLFTRDGGVSAAEALLSLPEPPDAIFCLSDLLALGAMSAIIRRGLTVPEDIAIVGFDDIEEGRFARPSLTSVSPDKKAIAAQTVRLLLSRIDGEKHSPTTVDIDFELVIRESSQMRPELR